MEIFSAVAQIIFVVGITGWLFALDRRAKVLEICAARLSLSTRNLREDVVELKIRSMPIERQMEETQKIMDAVTASMEES